MDKSCNNCNNQKSATCIQCHQDWEVAGELTGWNILSNSTCEDCKHRIGDGHPYGDIVCGIDGKLKHETRKCDTGKWGKILTDKERIRILKSNVKSLQAAVKDLVREVYKLQ